MSKEFALVAQLVEHTLGKGEVSGSNPLKSSIIKADMQISAFVLLIGLLSFQGDQLAWCSLLIPVGCEGEAKRLLKNYCWAGILVGLILLLGQ